MGASAVPRVKEQVKVKDGPVRDFETLRREIQNLVNQYNEILDDYQGQDIKDISAMIQDRIDEMISRGIVAIYYQGCSWQIPAECQFLVYEGPWGHLNISC